MFLFIKTPVYCSQCEQTADSKNKLSYVILFFAILALAILAFLFLTPAGGLANKYSGTFSSLFAALYVGSRLDAHYCRHCGSQWVRAADGS
jgi:hypothetical protein